MSSKTVLMRNLLDLGIVEHEDSLDSTFESSDHSTIIKFSRKKKPYTFNTTSSEYICKIEIENLMHTPILTISCNELDILRFIDNFLYFQETKVDSVYTYFGPDNISYIAHMIALLRDPLYDVYIHFFDYHEEQLILRHCLNLSENDMARIIELIEYTFLVDLDFETYEKYTETRYMNNDIEE